MLSGIMTIDLKQLDQELSRYVRMSTHPLAIRMVESEAEFDSKARRPKRDLDIEVTICQAIGMARRYGWHLAISPSDINCPLIFIPFGFSAEVPYSAEGHACAGVYTETLEAGAKTESIVPRLPQGKYAGIEMAPLNRASFAPQVICVYGNSAQVMRLVQASLYHGGGALTSIAAGRIDCAEIIIRTMLADEPQYILPCTGDRVFGLTEDDEMIFAMPARHAAQVVAGLQGTHQSGIRYPIPKYMRFTPSYPHQYDKLREALIETGGAGETRGPAGTQTPG
jgi:uncharacterized protein (DUF169 family)